MLATMCLLTLRATTSPRSLGKRESRRELSAEPVDLKKEREEREESPAKTVVKLVAKTVRKDPAETEKRVRREEEKEDAEETTDSDIWRMFVTQTLKLLLFSILLASKLSYCLYLR
jgi:hypothetical protein